MYIYIYIYVSVYIYIYIHVFTYLSFIHVFYTTDKDRRTLKGLYVHDSYVNRGDPLLPQDVHLVYEENLNLYLLNAKWGCPYFLYS